MRLTGKVAIVTGAGRGNGRGIALGLAREGAAVCIADIISENAEKVAQEIEEAGGRAIAVRTDVTNPSDVQAMTDATIRTFGKITTLVNNAGIMPRVAFFDTTWDEWRNVIDVNLNSVFLVTQVVAREMINAGCGSIINLSSLAAERGIPNRVGYCAAKGGIKAMNMSLAMTLAAHNIRVNAIAPGPIPTDMNPQLRTDPVAIAGWIGVVPLRRLGSPEDLAGICVYYASDESSWVTGTHICVDGGFEASFGGPVAPSTPQN